MFNVLFVFTIQMVLVSLVALNFVKDFEFTMMPWDVVIARFTCALILHLQQLPELQN